MGSILLRLFLVPLAEDFRTSIIESIAQGVDFSLGLIDTEVELSNYR